MSGLNFTMKKRVELFTIYHTFLKSLDILFMQIILFAFAAIAKQISCASFSSHIFFLVLVLI